MTREWAVVKDGVELIRFKTANEAIVTANHYNETNEEYVTVELVEDDN